MVVLVGFVHNMMMRFYMVGFVGFVGFVHNMMMRFYMVGFVGFVGIVRNVNAVFLYALVGTLARQRGCCFKG